MESCQILIVQFLICCSVKTHRKLLNCCKVHMKNRIVLFSIFAEGRQQKLKGNFAPGTFVYVPFSQCVLPTRDNKKLRDKC